MNKSSRVAHNLRSRMDTLLRACWPLNPRWSRPCLDGRDGLNSNSYKSLETYPTVRVKSHISTGALYRLIRLRSRERLTNNSHNVLRASREAIDQILRFDTGCSLTTMNFKRARNLSASNATFVDRNEFRLESVRGTPFVQRFQESFAKYAHGIYTHANSVLNCTLAGGLQNCETASSGN